MANSITLVGNVGGEPSFRTTASGTKVARVSLATSEKWKDRDSGERRERTEWHTLVFWGALAGVVEDYVHMGDRLYVRGALRYSRWNPNGVVKADGTAWEAESAEINVTDLEMLGGGRRGRGESDASPGTVAGAL